VTDIVFSNDPPADVAADVLVLPVYEGPQPGPGVREVPTVDLMEAYADAKLAGKSGEALRVPTPGGSAKAVLLVGVGDKAGVDAAALRRAIGKVAGSLVKQERIATTFPQAAGRRSAEEAFQATVEGLLLGSYRFTRYKTRGEDAEPSAIRQITVLGSARTDPTVAKRAIARGGVIAESVGWARDLVNTPAGDLPPDALAKEARAVLAPLGVTVKVWRRADLERGGMGGILGVGQGSANEPRMIELTYKRGRGAPVGLAGKGITFDSGGLSIKDAKNMETMKDDMAGAAAMLAAVRAVAALKARVSVIAAIPCSENMPGGSSIRPGDVLTHRGGKTSEVLNTDAEGRLVLADALAYLAERKPSAILDAATLTGACMVALGDEITGAMGNDRALMKEVLAAAEGAGEPAWELPLWEGYKKQIRSAVADVKNIGDRWGGAITAALFLAEFVDDVPWVHLDVAGPAFTDKPGDLGPKGGTGVPVRTVVRFLLGRAAGTARSA
jgi:leucyl aminopeptidase